MTPTSRTKIPTPPQERIIAAALRLFGQHGVGGTSLQMIADEIGVTKAAVYHQYNTKEEIVRAVAQAELARLDATLDAALDAASSDATADLRTAVVDHIIDLAIERRHQVASLLNDPIIGQLFAKDRRLRATLGRLNRLLMGDGAAPGSHVATAMLTAAVSGAVLHPMVADLDEDTLREQLRRLAHRFLDLPA